MSLFLTGLYCITSIIAMVMVLIFHMHMFQLNSYKTKEHTVWIKKNMGSIIGKTIGFYLSIPILLLFGNPGLIIASILNLLTAAGNRPKKAKKPLVYTKRVQRMFITLGMLYGAAAIVTFILYKIVILTALLLPLMGIFSGALILLANTMNKPVETAINQKFIEEARKIIREMPDLKVIGITGSYGKTSVKYFLNKLLSADYNVLMTPGNFNTTLGVVRTIREHLRATHQIFICEMGAKNIGDIKEICDLVEPDYGIITSIGPQHLESFGSVENVIKTKFELAEAVSKDGIVFLNYDNEYIVNKTIQKKYITYGVDNKNADFLPYNLTVSREGSVFSLKTPDGEEKTFSTRLIGKHNVLNIAGAIAVAYQLGVSMETLANQVRRLESVPHRLQLINSGRGLIIDDAYNSNPSGAKAALETLGAFDGIRILVTPGMVELGEKQTELNRIFGQQAAEYCDYIVLVGKKQTEPIQEGVRSKGYPENRLFVVDDLQEGLSKVDAIKSEGKEKIILLENDLPDNY
ncbi:UDP-N-acetylmuramoyl-tripeptide--D-alanyl-D-alanine ligase [Anaeromicropila populeti]|uniref:UDP-N-acetylmuramoyl-tripeptide--D-alanyl-D-alanine ligase n=1 Tax=Anaeromicropila populeti TaxID=37658 RepID=A0A1I6KKW6_9FIRM|nr:UDP-N-acetylmuramoyl-tripeptide--D-alanyl-D-alanine ligase [Anaeromicropila populeti]SFR91851.1 UDP-N-acetylmuramoyl-tripeptide--D-alanyl-D-alanine ligase [Anaeromicropila populeti]